MFNYRFRHGNRAVNDKARASFFVHIYRLLGVVIAAMQNILQRGGGETKDKGRDGACAQFVILLYCYIQRGTRSSCVVAEDITNFRTAVLVVAIALYVADLKHGAATPVHSVRAAKNFHI